MMLRERQSNVLVIHNAYRQSGGEDRVFELESRLLEAHGHRVFRYQDHNERVTKMGRVQLALSTVWNRRSYRDVSEILLRNQIDIIHIHNTFPLISPSVYYAAKRVGVPVVQTLHNYRLLCPDAKLMRNDKLCEDCLGRRFAWPGILHGCYQNSRPATAVAAVMTVTHGILGTWSDSIDRYVALTDFARRKFVEGGLPAGKIAVKPNFVDPDPGCGDGQGDYALFVGRLAPEKGIATLLAAWNRAGRHLPLRVVGDGPLADQVREAALQESNVIWIGPVGPEVVKQQMRGARFLICPSVWYESFGMIIVEAFATGLPVIGSNLGAMAELIDHERTGLLFSPGDPNDCARTVEEALAQPGLLMYMRAQARLEYERHYTASRNYDILMSIYDEAKGHSRTPLYQGSENELSTIHFASGVISKRVSQPPE